ncbi:hypothetical protein [Salinibacterium sp. TMP30]|uniref:hypothetical protein n=1 Tax=Salinibacterium sp. TMP30 TaxID=3138237 RepID=UPI0031396A91
MPQSEFSSTKTATPSPPVAGIALPRVSASASYWLTLSIWGLGILAVMAVAVQYVPSATIDINWIDVGLSAIAIAATLKAGRNPRAFTLPLPRRR